jgi:hypothetical protein
MSLDETVSVGVTAVTALNRVGDIVNRNVLILNLHSIFESASFRNTDSPYIIGIYIVVER